MRIITAILSIVATGIPASPTPSVSARSGPAATPMFDEVRKLPDDVIAFRAQRDRCDELRGEEPTDEARAAFLAHELGRTCRGTDAALAKLRKRYATSRTVSEALAGYDTAIE